ncbi:MAG: hypothetical protein WCN98_12855, partial [Verrucomicrobiaceae bacterium]
PEGEVLTQGGGFLLEAKQLIFHDQPRIFCSRQSGFRGALSFLGGCHFFMHDQSQLGASDDNAKKEEAG